MDLSLIYRALAGGDVDVIAGDATSALIDRSTWRCSADDRGYFPPYDAVAVARAASLLRDARIRDAHRGAGRPDFGRSMRAMNHAADVEHRDVGAIVREFIEANYLRRAPSR